MFGCEQLPNIQNPLLHNAVVDSVLVLLYLFRPILGKVTGLYFSNDSIY